MADQGPTEPLSERAQSVIDALNAQQDSWLGVVAAIDWFEGVMRDKLQENQDKGNRPGWLACDQNHLLARLADEIKELEGAIREGDAVAIAKECGDVANFALMIGDKAMEEAGHKLEFEHEIINFHQQIVAKRSNPNRT